MTWSPDANASPDGAVSLPAPNTPPTKPVRFDVSRFDAGVAQHDQYRMALEHLYGRLDTEALAPDVFNTVDRDLQVYRSFLERLGDPHRSCPAIHVTGTRGKGSFAASLEAILHQAGYRTGATVSPHLVEVRERIRIDGQDLSREEFARLYHSLLKPAMEAENYQESYRTVFELITALAFLAFRDMDVDVAVVEVGMGGRLDATNVLEPALSAITRVGLDHTKVLGDTIEKIAWDKAHILKPGVPGVIGPQSPAALSMIEERATFIDSELWRIGYEIQLDAVEVSDRSTRFHLKTPARDHRELETPLLGAHMAENVGLAVAAADRLHVDGEFLIPPEAIRKGLLKTSWPGRAEILQRNPLVMIDGAHSPLGASALKRLLDDVWPDRPRVLLLGVNRDKDVNGFLNALDEKPALTIATAADTPRAMTSGELAGLLKNRGWDTRSAPLPQAFDLALAEASQRDAIVIGTGSLYLVGALRRLWLTRNQQYPTFGA
ncbi:MAG: folylpolyglutamate synthase/dihydrofolate synthase family protein [bacterium]